MDSVLASKERPERVSVALPSAWMGILLMHPRKLRGRGNSDEPGGVYDGLQHQVDNPKAPKANETVELCKQHNLRCRWDFLKNTHR